MQKFKEMILYNTIANHDNPDGLTYYDLTQIDPHIPHSRIYRAMKKLEEEGFLKKKEVITELGRPKHYYSLTDKGMERHLELKENLLALISVVQERLKDDIGSIEFSTLPRPNLTKFNPTEMILEENCSADEKLEHLTKFELHFRECLEKIAEAKRLLNKGKTN